jgi:3,4-dihydroxy 2-butanone 4-phosphate synthase / GTP cyclohydrolase II
MHAVDVLDDIVMDRSHAALQCAMGIIAEAGRGVVVLLRENRATKLSERVRTLAAGPRPGGELRDYGIGAQILIDLGVHEMILLSNTDHNIIGLEGYGLRVVGREPIGKPRG